MGDVRIEKVEDRIWLNAPYNNGEGPRLAKKVLGHNWNGQNKVWTYPLDLQTCRDLRQVYGDRLVIGPELNAWAHAAVNHENQMVQLGRSMDAELTTVFEHSPKLAKAMASRTYQRSGARFVATGRRVLIADEPSLGKTATSLAGIMEAGAWEGDHLVVAPKTSLKSTWARQINLWTDAEAFPMPEGKANRKKTLEEFLNSPAKSKFLIVNPAMVRMQVGDWCAECRDWIDKKKDRAKHPNHFYYEHKTVTEVKLCDWPEVIGHEWTSCIVDECHELFSLFRGPRAQSGITQTMQGMMRIQPDIRIALTGTPLRGYEKKLAGTFSWLGVIEGGYWRWVQQWMAVDKSGFGWSIIGLLADKEESFYRHIDTYVRRLTKKEARPDLPDKDPQPVWVDLEGKHKRQYLEFLTQGEVELEDSTLSSLGVLSELTRLKQMAFGVWENRDGKFRPTGESPKIDWLLQALAERGVTGDPKTEFLPEEGLGYKYVIASQFTEVVDATERVLNKQGIKTLKVTGDVTGKRRDTSVARWQSDDKEYRVLLINTKAGGVSIDLDAWCDEMFILDETWIADDQVQLEGRIDNRTGRVAPRTFYYIRTSGTIEEEIAESNLSQDEMQKKLLDSRRGVETAIRIIKKLKES